MQHSKTTIMRAIKFWMIICLPVLLNTSCKKFLDVKSSNQVLQEELFKDGDGIHIAVNGVYRILSSTELYGKNLTWGFMSGLGYNYDVNYLPYDIRDAAQFHWDYSNTQKVTEDIWKKAYNALANCNNIIQEVEKKDSGFFAQKSNEKNMILGEMYGIRAMIHFDLLRIFSPAPSSGYTGLTIPYVSSYPEYQPARLDMNTIFTRIIADMELSKSLLAPVDTLFITVPGSRTPIIRYTTGRIRNTGGYYELPIGEFFNYRGERMNFFGATSLLARIYMYKGDYENAYKNAKIVYDIHKRNWFQWTSSIYQGQITDVDYIYTKRPDELLLTFSNAKNYDNWDNVFMNSPGSQFFRMNSTYMNKLFESDLDDYRLVGWYNRYGDQRYLTWSRPRGTSYNADQVTKNQGPLLPVIRFSEMDHIIIEYYIKQNRITDAVNMLNDIRINRGAKNKIPTSISPNELMEKLVKDMVRESLTEGQTFFLFKRLNRNIFNGETDVVMKPADWFAPLPQSEIAYQL